MCGGQVLTHPCSHVAHTFKPFAYEFPGDGREKIVQRNQMRLAELWMDDWKKFFLASTYNWPTKHTFLSDAEKRSLAKRKALKQNLQCKGFQWYLETIIPEVPTPPMDADYYGEVFNLRSELCFYLARDGYVGLTSFCFFHRLIPQNIFYIDRRQRLKYRDRCVVVDRPTWLLRVTDCPAKQTEFWDTWRHSEVEGMIVVRLRKNPGDTEDTTLCPTQVTNILSVHHNQQMPQMLDCQRDNRFQKWRWTYKFDFGYNWENPNVTRAN
jgi:polypeptide N-acetylgalactosaminyltransferase